MSDQQARGAPTSVGLADLLGAGPTATRTSRRRVSGGRCGTSSHSSADACSPTVGACRAAEAPRPVGLRAPRRACRGADSGDRAPGGRHEVPQVGPPAAARRALGPATAGRAREVALAARLVGLLTQPGPPGRASARRRSPRGHGEAPPVPGLLGIMEGVRAARPPGEHSSRDRRRRASVRDGARPDARPCPALPQRVRRAVRRAGGTGGRSGRTGCRPGRRSGPWRR